MLKRTNNNLPTDWVKAKLEDILQINPPVGLKIGKSYPFLDMSDVEPGRRSPVFTKTRVFDGSGSKFEAGDVLFARITPCLEKGKIVQIRNVSTPAFGSTEFFVLRGKEGVITNDFVYYLVRTPQVRKRAEQSMVGVSGRQRVELDAFKKIEVYIPRDIQEQKRIADFLSAFDDKIELNEKIIRTIEKMAMTIFEEWFVHLRFPGYEKIEFVDSELGKIPKGWRVGNLGEIMIRRVERVKSYKEWMKEKLLDLGRFPRKSLAMVSYGKGEEIKSSVLRFKEGDILFGAVRPYFHKVLIAPFNGVTNASVFIIYPRNAYHYCFLVCTLFSDSTIAYATRCASGTKMPVLKWEDLCSMQLVIPEESVLYKFNEIVNPLLLKLLENVKENQILASLRDLLLPKLMSGEVRIPD